MQSISSVGLGRNGWLRAPAAAAFVGLSTSTLAKMRLRGDGPPYSKLTPRIVIYSTTDLDAWISSRRRLSTSAKAVL